MPSKITTKSRTLPRSYAGSMQYYFYGDRYLNSVGTRDVHGTQKTVSEGHPVSKLSRSDEDLGGDFDSFKSEVVYVSHPGVSYRYDTFPIFREYWEYKGCIVPPNTKPHERDKLPLRSIDTLNAMGATAVARCSPVNSHSEFLTSLSETLKDGLPAVPGISQWQARTAAAKGAGSEYLNAQFGWVPLVNDLQAVYSSARNSAKLMKQFRRDAGRNVRRRYEFPVEVESIPKWDSYEGVGAATKAGLSTYSLQSSFFDNGDESGYSWTDREISRKTWFSGAFTYHMPASNTQVGKFMRALQEYDLLFGGVPTPDVVWNLTPWSWATDWFANTGDVLTNVSNAMLYGQVMRYGYLMEQTTILDRNYLVLPNHKFDKRFESVVKTTVKRRIRANPFGFGITYDGLNAYQLSILAALGMTRR